MSEEWTHVRLRRATYARLRVVQRGFEASYLAGRIGHLPGGGAAVSADQLVNYLIDQLLGHRLRAAKSRRARRSPDRPADG